MVSVKLSPLQIKVLATMAKITKRRKYRIARPSEIARYMKKKMKSVEAVLLKLRKKGVVENVGFGAWRITELGWQVLKELGYA